MKNNKIATILSFISLAAWIILDGCARQGSPSGGPKDETPPEIISETPPNRSVYFNSTKAVLTFSEFVSLKDPSKEIFVSPPMRVKPVYKAQGKKIVIEFQEALKENSTYTINFGNSIVDYTEGNPNVNFEYVFSTGSQIDSLSIPGKVVNAFDLKPETGIIVMVYQDDNDTIPLDSLPYKVPPKSASRTTKDGSFSINNLAPGFYKLFALEDLNNNFIFDLPNERIGFLDSLVNLEPPPVSEIPADTLAEADTANLEMTISLPDQNSYQLYLFSQRDTVQKLMSKKLIGHNLLQYIFKLPADSVRISPYNFDPGRSDWYIMEPGVLKDTVNFWLKPGLPDTMRVIVMAMDSIADTSRYILSKGAFEGKGRKKEATAGSMRISSSNFAGALDLNKPLSLSFAVPVEDYEPDRIRLFTSTDSLLVPFAFNDTLRRTGTIDYKWMPGEIYNVIIEDSVFCDLSNSYNDSTIIRFKVRSMEDYGVLLLNIIPGSYNGQFIVQVMTDKEFVLREKTVRGQGQVEFNYLTPNTYKLKVIYDANSNGKWDTGEYGKKLLPEKVEYYPDAVVVRANWDLQEDWQLKD